MPKSTRSALIAKADKVFSRYIRYRDGQKLINDDTGEEEWWTQCITCDEWKPMNKMHAGHFQSRRYMATRWEEFNVNGQCAKCNTFNAGEQYKYAKALEDKYGKGVSEQLEVIARKPTKITEDQIRVIIKDAEEEIKRYEKL